MEKIEITRIKAFKLLETRVTRVMKQANNNPRTVNKILPQKSSKLEVALINEYVNEGSFTVFARIRCQLSIATPETVRIRAVEPIINNCNDQCISLPPIQRSGLCRKTNPGVPLPPKSDSSSYMVKEPVSLYGYWTGTDVFSRIKRLERRL